MNQLANLINLSQGREVVFDIPPPFPTARFHPGHLLQYSFIIVRINLLKKLGWTVAYEIGFDVNGVPVCLKARANLGKDASRAQIVKECQRITASYIPPMLAQFDRLGFETASYYTTRSSEYLSVIRQYLDLAWSKGILKDGEKLGRFCPKCRCSLSKSEVSKISTNTKTYWIEFTAECGKPFWIWTTRAELLGNAVAFCFSKGDERYSSLDGDFAYSPFTNSYLPILSSGLVKTEVGSGMEFVASYGGANDYSIIKELKLDGKNHIDEFGLISRGVFKGETIDSAKDLVESSIIKYRLNYRTELVSISRDMHTERGSCNAPIQYILNDEAVIKPTLEEKNALIKEINELKNENKAYDGLNWRGSTTITNDREYDRLIQWVKHYDEWCVSRQYEYGTDLGHGRSEACDGWVDSSVSAIYLSRKYGIDQVVRVQGGDIILTWGFFSLFVVGQLRRITESRTKFVEFHFTPLVVGDDGKKMSKSRLNWDEKITLELTEGSADLVKLWAYSYNSDKKTLKIDSHNMAILKKFINKYKNLAVLLDEVGQVTSLNDNITNRELLQELIHKEPMVKLACWILIDAVEGLVECRSNPLQSALYFFIRDLSNTLMKKKAENTEFEFQQKKKVLKACFLILHPLIKLFITDSCELVEQKYLTHPLEFSESYTIAFSLFEVGVQSKSKFLSQLEIIKNQLNIKYGSTE